MKGLIVPLLLCIASQGNTATECYTYNETEIQCNFTKSLSSTQTNFQVYFFPNNGKSDLLIDCVWHGGKLVCVEQEGLKYKQPVSNIFEISVPPRFRNKAGSYICLPEGDNTKDSKPCQFVENQKNDETELDKSHPDQTENAEVGCKATVEGHLMCTFPENVNITETDFGVYFYPVHGGEEPLLDCGWVNSQLHCMKQEGVECKSPVNTTAVIIIPTRFLEENGKYRCVCDGHRHNNIKPCQMSSKEVLTNAARMLSDLSSVMSYVYLVTILLFC